MPDIEILYQESFTRDNEKNIPEAWVFVSVRTEQGLIEQMEFKGSDWQPSNRQNLIRKELEQRLKNKT